MFDVNVCMCVYRLFGLFDFNGVCVIVLCALTSCALLCWVVMLLLVRVVLQAFVRFVGCAGESDFEAALALGGVWWSVARAVISNS